MSNESAGSGVRYGVVHEEQLSALLRMEWAGNGVDVESGESIEIAKTDPRRKIYVDISFMSVAPMPWRSNLDRGLKVGELTRDDLSVQPLEHLPLVRVSISGNEHLGDFFFRAAAAADLSSDSYIAQCSTVPPRKGAITCSTQIDVASFAAKIDFDRAFLWDFDRLQAEAVAAVNDYIARPSTQRLIDSIPPLGIP